MAEPKRRHLHRDNGIVCFFCDVTVPYRDPLYELKPCRCKAHPRCLLDAHAGRGTSVLKCPQCEVIVEFHRHYLGERNPSSQAAVPYKTGGRVFTEKELEMKYPFQ